MSILFYIRKIYPYFSLFSDVLSCVIERAITALSKDEHIFINDASTQTSNKRKNTGTYGYIKCNYTHPNKFQEEK